MANEVRIKLTEDQKAKIKEGTGKEMDEIRVGQLGNNPAVSSPAVKSGSVKSGSVKSGSVKSGSVKSGSVKGDF